MRVWSLAGLPKLCGSLQINTAISCTNAKIPLWHDRTIVGTGKSQIPISKSQINPKCQTIRFAHRPNHKSQNQAHAFEHQRTVATRSDGATRRPLGFGFEAAGRQSTILSFGIFLGLSGHSPSLVEGFWDLGFYAARIGHPPSVAAAPRCVICG